MKCIFKIASGFVAVYFTALPILFGYHSFQHQFRDNDDHKSGYTEGELMTSCSLCDLFDSQAAAVDAPISYDVKLITPPFEPVLFENRYRKSLDFQLLRGPPVS